MDKITQKFDTVLFDLDGTLTDPFEGITNSVVHALKKFGIEVEDKRTLKCFIGPPLYHSFQKYYGLTEENSLKAVEYYREYFAVKGLFENSVYEGIEEVLKTLKSRGKKLIVATSKPEEFAKRILNHFGLSKYFDFIAGATMDSSRVEKADVIRYALKIANVKNLQTAVMVGDRLHDVSGAKSSGLKCVGVLYGYGEEEELLSAGAEFIAATPNDILKIIL